MRAPPAASSADDVPVQLLDHRLGEESARDAGLVGHHHHPHAGAVQRADGVDGPGIELDAIRPIEIADLFDQRAVAIEEHRPVCGHSTRIAASAAAVTSMPRMQA